MIQRAAPSFWEGYNALEPNIQKLANRSFEVLKRDPQHPSLRLKKTGRFWSARVGLHHVANSPSGFPQPFIPSCILTAPPSRQYYPGLIDKLLGLGDDRDDSGDTFNAFARKGLGGSEVSIRDSLTN